VDRADEPFGPPLKSGKRSSAGVDLELEVGARAHFEDPSYYDATYADRHEDVAYYTELGARHKRILEHGVGTGRIALPLARAGSSVTGVDHSREMLARLRERLATEPEQVRKQLTLVRGDMRTKRFEPASFSLAICPFNAALHLYRRTDIEAWLSCVREALTARGELVFDVSMPNPADLGRNPAVPFRTPPFRHPTMGRVRYWEHFDYDAPRQVMFVSMHFQPMAKGKSSFMTPLAQRMFFPQELEALLHYNGWRMTECYGDFSKGPLTNDSDVMVIHARKRPWTRQG